VPARRDARPMLERFMLATMRRRWGEINVRRAFARGAFVAPVERGMRIRVLVYYVMRAPSAASMPQLSRDRQPRRKML